MRRLVGRVAIAVGLTFAVGTLTACEPSCGDGGYPWSPPGCQHPVGNICTGNVCVPGRT